MCSLRKQCQAFAANPDLKLPLQCVAKSESISANVVVLCGECEQQCTASVASASKARICRFGCSEATPVVQVAEIGGKLASQNGGR